MHPKAVLGIAVDSERTTVSELHEQGSGVLIGVVGGLPHIGDGSDHPEGLAQYRKEVAHGILLDRLMPEGWGFRDEQRRTRKSGHCT